ncbi:peptidase S8, subtilisin-related [Kipferlia bialata]|uniref:Peptidase S8, subtilisin-related n=1 Tax=Kipferlia bialata TaxID=797122 RepID=A0A9K3CM98_9EUKA|nr:peptidase S8, subtilisin-related [Kipferlia bialata]|eukprot:g394.t1
MVLRVLVCIALLACALGMAYPHKGEGGERVTEKPRDHPTADSTHPLFYYPSDRVPGRGVDSLFDTLSASAMCLITLFRGVDPDSVAASLGSYLIPTAMPHTFRVPCFNPGVAYASDRTADMLLALEALKATPGVRGVIPADTPGSNEPHQVYTPTDPEYSEQWWARNRGVGGCDSGVDINVRPVWSDGYFGQGVTVCVNDEGLLTGSPDLTNIRTDLCYNYDTDRQTCQPTQGFNTHGTSCAGILTAKHNNNKCVAGIAPEADLTGRCVLGTGVTVSEEAAAFTDDADQIDISSNSYGYPVCQGNLCYAFADMAWLQDAYEAAVSEGSIIFTSAGNSGDMGGDANMAGDKRSADIINVGALSCTGVPAFYSTPGSNVFCSAPGGDRTSASSDFELIQTLKNADFCEDGFSGTRAAYP